MLGLSSMVTPGQPLGSMPHPLSPVVVPSSNATIHSQRASAKEGDGSGSPKDHEAAWAAPTVKVNSTRRATRTRVRFLDMAKLLIRVLRPGHHGQRGDRSHGTVQ